MEDVDFRSVDSNTRKEIRKLAINKICSGVKKNVVADLTGDTK
jgi:ribosomal protein L33